MLRLETRAREITVMASLTLKREGKGKPNSRPTGQPTRWRRDGLRKGASESRSTRRGVGPSETRRSAFRSSGVRVTARRAARVDGDARGREVAEEARNPRRAHPSLGDGSWSRPSHLRGSRVVRSFWRLQGRGRQGCRREAARFGPQSPCGSDADEVVAAARSYRLHLVAGGSTPRHRGS
jgi:hypothetical protein